MINTNLLTVRNIAVIGGMALIAHMLIRPIYGLIQNKGS